MADVVTSVFTTTLLVLYFVAPAKTVHLNGTIKAKEAFEKNQLWTLQSASEITTENPNECVANGLVLRGKFAPVSTVTVRLYCFCSAEALKHFDVCENANTENVSFLARSNVAAPPTAVIEIGPDTQMPKTSAPSK
jgi:hypothetical protein